MDRLRHRLVKHYGFAPVFAAPFFRECVLCPPEGTQCAWGYDLGRDYPELSGARLLCCTEKDGDERREGILSAWEAKR
jgi:hypothetical protein